MSTIAAPRAASNRSSSSGTAPLRGQGYRVLQTVLFVAGGVLLPTGLVVIVLGWYGAAHTPYAYDQLSYLVSGGLLGLGLTFCGGFLYFGAWLARIAADNRETSRRLGDSLLVLADVVSRSADHGSAGQQQADRDPGEIPVVAGEGTTVHRRDCPLIQERDDLQAIGDHTQGLTRCRVCQPSVYH